MSSLYKMPVFVYPDPEWRTHRNLQEALLSRVCFIRVGLADFHRPPHVHQHPHRGGVQHAGPSAFSVPHLPSGGRHHRGETHKQARVCCQTLQTAARPRGHVAGPFTDLPGPEPPSHCAYDADAIPSSLDMQTRSRRKAQCVATRDR